MSLPTTTKVWILQNPPETDVKVGSWVGGDTFKMDTEKLPEVGEGEITVEVLYLSNDPAQRGWIQKGVDPARMYVPPVKQGEVMHSWGLGRVISSKSKKFNVGQLVKGTPGWREFGVFKDSEMELVTPAPDVRESIYLGVLGLNGLTAHVGLSDIAKISKEDKCVVVSGAAGVTGQVAIQMAKNIIGCARVIGIAGGAEKCNIVKSLGADECVDYKSKTYEEDLKKATEGFVAVFFDNVGGETLDLMLKRMQKNGRIVACGAISTYNDPSAPGLKNYFEVIAMRLDIQGFIVLDYEDKLKKYSADLAEWVKAGKIKLDHCESIVEAPFEKVPETWTGLFSGKNVGKLVTKLK